MRLGNAKFRAKLSLANPPEHKTIDHSEILHENFALEKLNQVPAATFTTYHSFPLPIHHPFSR